MFTLYSTYIRTSKWIQWNCWINIFFQAFAFWKKQVKSTQQWTLLVQLVLHYPTVLTCDGECGHFVQVLV